MTTAALVLVALLAWLYSVVGGVEFGLPVVWLVAAPAERRRLSAYLTPVWEVTNVLAVLAFVGLLVLFPSGLVALAAELRGPLLLVGGLLLVRAFLVLVVFYLKHQGRGWMASLAVVSLALVATLFQLPLRLVAGPQPGWLAAVVWGLLGAVSAVALAAGSFAWRRDPAPARLTISARWLALVTIVLAWAALMVVLPNRADYLLNGAQNWWWLVVLLPLAVSFGAAAWGRARLSLVSLVAMLAGLWLFLLIHQPPYLAYPAIGLANSVATRSTVLVALISTVFFALILLPFGLWLYLAAFKGSE